MAQLILKQFKLYLFSFGGVNIDYSIDVALQLLILKHIVTETMLHFLEDLKQIFEERFYENFKNSLYTVAFYGNCMKVESV